MSRRHLVLAVLTLLIAIPALPAHAATSTSGTVRVAEGYYPVSGAWGPYTYASEPCAVTVAKAPGKVSAHDMLAAAEAARCVSSYKVIKKPPYGSYLLCVEARCESLGFYWAIYRNGTLTCQGLDDVPVKAKDEIVFSYEAYPTALALASCGP